MSMCRADQLVLKMVCIAFAFCSALPILLPIATLFMYLSYRIDRYNLLRVFKAPPRTTDRTVAMSVLYILPIAAFAHVLVAIFFYSKQASVRRLWVYRMALLPSQRHAVLACARCVARSRLQCALPNAVLLSATMSLSTVLCHVRPPSLPSAQANLRVPLAYYACLILLAAVIMGKISSELSQQSRRPIRESAATAGSMIDGSAEPPGAWDSSPNGGMSYEGSNFDATASYATSVEEGGVGTSAALPGTMLRDHLDSIELYVPPLTSHLLNDLHATIAQQSDPFNRTTSSTR